MPPYAIWSVWRSLGFLDKVFFVGLVALIVCSVFSAAIAAIALRKARSGMKEDRASMQRTLRRLRKQSNRVQKSLGTTFCIFGAVLFLGFQWAYVVLGESNVAPSWVVLKTLETEFVFGFNVFLLLLLLLALRWFIADRVDTYTLLLDQET